MKQARIKWVDGFQFVGTADSGHGVVMDAGADMNGADSGIRPAELTLMALGGCTGIDVVNILKKKKLSFEKFEVKVEADPVAELPYTLETFRLKYILHGAVSELAFKKAIELSVTKYCSVGMLLKQGAEIHHRYELINGDQIAQGDV